MLEKNLPLILQAYFSNSSKFEDSTTLSSRDERYVFLTHVGIILYFRKKEKKNEKFSANNFNRKIKLIQSCKSIDDKNLLSTNSGKKIKLFCSHVFF